MEAILWIVLGIFVGVFVHVAKTRKKSNPDYLAKADKWLGTNKFKNFRYDAKRVLAEYLADQDGKTLGFK